MKKTQEISSDAFYANLERLVFLIDGVFSITITLLVLELRPPEGSAKELGQNLLELVPRLYIYLIAFYSIANHWVVHQRMFRHITDIDKTMVWLTLLWLLFLTLIPATTAIVGRYPGENLAAICFSANSFLQAIVGSIFWAYVYKHYDRFAYRSDPRLLKITSQVWMMISAGWFLSMLIGFFNNTLAYISWVALPNLAAVWGGYKRKNLHKTKVI